MNAELKSLLRELPRNRREHSNLFGILLFICFLAVWTLTLTVVLVSPLWLSLIGVLGNGLSIATLFIVGHDAAHGSLVTSRRANWILSTLALLPALHPVSSWKRSHNTKHHAWTNLKGEDPGYAPLSFEEFRRLSPARKLSERLCRTSIGLGLFYFLDIYCKEMMFPIRSRQPATQSQFARDRLVVAMFLLLEFGLAYATSIAIGRTFPVLFSAYAILAPFSVFMWLIGAVTYLHHTNPAIPWFDKKTEWSFFQTQVAGTTHVIFPRIFDAILLNIHVHSAHHVDPLIPLYHLPTSQLKLEAAYPTSVKVIGSDPRIFFNTLRRCKLYDYDGHCWLDFNGRPTSPRLVESQISDEKASVVASRDSTE